MADQVAEEKKRQAARDRVEGICLEVVRRCRAESSRDGAHRRLLPPLPSATAVDGDGPVMVPDARAG